MVKALREQGYDVRAILEESRSITDDEVLQIAVEGDAVLVTEDKDFGEMVFRLGMTTPGVLLIRFHELEGEDKIRLIRTAFEEHSSRFRGAFSVVTDKALRIRPFKE